MTARKLLGTALAAALLVATTGCGTIYSKQNYGSPTTQVVTAGARKADIFANMGQPNATYKGAGQEVFVYRRVKGCNILGLFSKIDRTDYVVIYDEAEQKVVYAADVPVGKGMTILSPPMLDATHPVRTETLLFEAQNYDYEFSVEP